MAEHSAGILLWRRRDRGVEVLLAHMGGPFWARKDAGAWSIPKGLYDVDEEPLAAARREFREELGVEVPTDDLVALGEVRQSSGKRLSAWAAEADLDPAAVEPGMFTMEWPPRSGKTAQFPEVDRVEWFGLDTAAGKLVKGQRPFLDLLNALLA